MDADTFIPLVFFSFLAAVILVPIMAKEQTKRSAHTLISQAVERGQPLDPALLSKLSHGLVDAADRPRRSLGNAVILLSLAGGFVAAGAFIDGDPRSGFYVPAIIAGSVGIAFLLLAIVDYATKKQSA